MAFDIHTLDPVTYPAMVPHRIVPLRFARAVTGFADKDAPDMDDHGFTVADEFGPNKGPTVGVKRGVRRNGAIQPGPTVRVKVIRDRIDAAAQLFPKIEDPTIAELVSPAAGSALSATTVPAAGDTPEREGDCIYLRGTSQENNTREVKLTVHHGSETGPSLAELTIRVMPVLTIPVKLHRVGIKGGAAPATSLATLQRLFRRVNAVYCQAGIEFDLNSTIDTENVTTVNFSPTARVTFEQTNLITYSIEALTLLTVNRDPDALNGYFFADYASTTAAGGAADLATLWGWGASRSHVRPRQLFDTTTNAEYGQPGITFKDPDSVADSLLMADLIAHELGHCLTMEHYMNGQRSATNTDGTIRHDIWAHRNLMHNYVDINATWGETYMSSAARVQVGYGAGKAGQMLMIKKRAGIFQSDQVSRLRDAKLNNAWKGF